MSIAVTCVCGQKFKAPVSAAGKQLQCPKCKAPLVVPAIAAAPADDPLAAFPPANDPFADDGFGQDPLADFSAQQSFDPASGGYPQAGYAQSGAYAPVGGQAAGAAKPSKRTKGLMIGAGAAGLLVLALLALGAAYMFGGGAAPATAPVAQIDPPNTKQPLKPIPNQPSPPTQPPLKTNLLPEDKKPAKPADGQKPKPEVVEEKPADKPATISLPPVELDAAVELAGGASVAPPKGFVAGASEQFGTSARWMKVRRWKHPDAPITFFTAVVHDPSFESALHPRVSARNTEETSNIRFNDLDMWVVPGALTREMYAGGRYRALATRRSSTQYMGAAILVSSYAAGNLYATYIETTAPVSDELFASLGKVTWSLNVQTAKPAQPPTDLALNEEVFRTGPLTASSTPSTGTVAPAVPDKHTLLSLAISADGSTAIYGDVSGMVHTFGPKESGVRNSWKVVQGASASYLSPIVGGIAMVGAEQKATFVKLRVSNGDLVNQFSGSKIKAAGLFGRNFFVARDDALVVHYAGSRYGEDDIKLRGWRGVAGCISDDETLIGFVTVNGLVALFEHAEEKRKTTQFKEKLHPGSIGSAVAISKDNKKMLTADTNGLLALWNCTSGTLTRKWDSLGRINAVTFVNGDEALVQHADSISRVELSRGKITLEKKFPQQIIKGAFSRDAKHGVFARVDAKSRQDIFYWESK